MQNEKPPIKNALLQAAQSNAEAKACKSASFLQPKKNLIFFLPPFKRIKSPNRTVLTLEELTYSERELATYLCMKHEKFAEKYVKKTVRLKIVRGEGT